MANDIAGLVARFLDTAPDAISSCGVEHSGPESGTAITVPLPKRSSSRSA